MRTEVHNRRVGKKLTKTLDQTGSVSLLMAAMLLGLCGLVALAIDIGHVLVVRAELQKAADAGALSGALNLAPYTGSYPDLTPDWLKGRIAAAATVNIIDNEADNQPSSITSSDVLSGYWMLQPQGQSQTLSQSLPLAIYIPAPAIRVTLTRTVQLIFAPVIEASNIQNLSAAATAILPEGSGITGAFAMAVEKSKVFNPSINTAPQSFGYGDSAQWYNRDGTNSVTAIRRNDQLQANDTIYLPPGAMDTLYSLIQAGQTIMVPVVESKTQPPPPLLTEKEWYPIIAFVPFYVTGMSGKSISGNFVDKYISPGAAPSNMGGTYSGISGTPKLIGP